MNAVTEFQSRLRAGEELLWQGTPDSRRWLTPRDAPGIIVGLMIGGFAIFWEKSAAGIGAPAAFRGFSLVFLLAGVWLVAGRIVARHLRYTRTRYAITNQRVMILSGRNYVEAPLRDQQISVTRSRNHATVLIGERVAVSGSVPNGQGGFTRSVNYRDPATTLYHVAEPGPMLAALDQARAPRLTS